VAVPQAERVAELVYGFFREALREQLGTPRLVEAIVGHYRAVALELSLAENERQDRDEQVQRADAENAPAGPWSQLA
jgi:hypothetical protein